jgi:mono/diheme cytochrome c family protein
VRARTKLGLAGAAVLALVGSFLLSAFVLRGFSARDEPSGVEAFVARRLRHLAVPVAAREAENPITLNDDVLAEGRAHFADHCALCHGNDGRGDTPIGRNLYPRAPDMQAADTQTLSDGELFYIIENGVRLTGMPAWGGSGSHDDEASWQLVHFIRHLPELTPAELAEMAELNPRSRHGHRKHSSAAPHHRH